MCKKSFWVVGVFFCLKLLFYKFILANGSSMEELFMGWSSPGGSWYGPVGSPALSLVFADFTGTALDTPLVTLGNDTGFSS